MLSEGRCTLCGLNFDKSVMPRHLGVCLTRRPLEGAWRQRTFWLFVEVMHQPASWFHLEAPLAMRLSLLERFLHRLWPEGGEAAGALVIAGRRYEGAGEGPSPAEASLEDVLAPGISFKYVGAENGLKIRVVGRQERAWAGQKIEVLAHSLSFHMPDRRA